MYDREMPLRNALLLVLVPVVSFAQLSSGSVTVSVSRSSNVQPDQVVFSLTVTSSADKSLGDIVSALSGLGISAPNLVGLSSGSQSPGIITLGPSQPSLNWEFQLTVPLTRMKDVTASLTSLQKTIGQQNSGLSLSFSVQGTQVSAQSSNCDFGGLMTDARNQAQTIAGGAGFSAGAITGITSAISTASAVPCSLTVRFVLSGYEFLQTQPSVITVTASRPVSSQADQVLIDVNVTSVITAGISDVTAALSGAGITGATFTGVNTITFSGPQNQPQPDLVWSFTISTPLAKLKDTLTQLSSAAQKLVGTLGLSSWIEGTQSSQSPSCPESTWSRTRGRKPKKSQRRPG